MTTVACLRHHAASQPDAPVHPPPCVFETWQIPLPLSILLLAEGPDLLVLARDASIIFKQLLHQGISQKCTGFPKNNETRDLGRQRTSDVEIYQYESGFLIRAAGPLDPSTTEMPYRMGKWAI